MFAEKPQTPVVGPLVEEISPGVFRRNDAVNSRAPSLLFDSDVQARLSAAGASLEGDIKAALSWNSEDDLDLHCFDPSGTRIYFNHRRSASEGELDVDQNAERPYRNDPVEHIFWRVGGAPSGKYRFLVYLYTKRTDLSEVPFRLDVLIGDKRVTKQGSVARVGRNASDGLEVVQFTYQRQAHAVQKTSPTIFMLGVATVGLTLGALACGTSLFITSVQSRMLGASSWVPSNPFKVVMMSLASGVLAGLVGQAVLTSLVSGASVSEAKFYKVVAWVVVGGLLGFSFSLFIPNLDRSRAVIGGLIGGLLSGFMLASVFSGNPTVGRLMACVVLGGSVGLAVALVEAMAREGYLKIIWGPGEFTTVNLGANPVTVGTGPESTIKIPKSSGYPPTIASFTMSGGKAVMHHNMTGQRHQLRNGNKLPLGTVTIEVCLFS